MSNYRVRFSALSRLLASPAGKAGPKLVAPKSVELSELPVEFTASGGFRLSIGKAMAPGASCSKRIVMYFLLVVF
jgi:hypothetical protein